MRRFLLVLLAMTVISTSAIAFQLKGVSIGMTTAQACKGAEVTDRLGDLIRKMRATVPSLIEMGTSECRPPVAELAGHPLAEVPHALFLDGGLILLKVELADLSWDDAIEIASILAKEYGKPSIRRSNPFTTLTWKRGGQTLLLERNELRSEGNTITLLLRSDAGYKRYDAAYEKNRTLLERASTAEKRDSLLN